MTQHNAFQHDGFGGLVNSGFNARNGGCVPVTRLICQLPHSGNTSHVLRVTDKAFSVVANWSAPTFALPPASADFDGQGRIWSYHADAVVRCATSGLSSVLYTSPALAHHSAQIQCCDKEGACYLWFDPSGAGAPRDHQVIKYAADLSGQAWATATLNNVRQAGRLWYVAGFIYDSMLDALTGAVSLRKIDAATGATVWTKANLWCRSPAPGGGFLGVDTSVVPNVIGFYDIDGVATGVTIPDLLGAAYVTHKGTTYAEVGFDKIRAYDAAGVQSLEITRIEATGVWGGNGAWQIFDLAVDDCTPGTTPGQIFCVGKFNHSSQTFIGVPTYKAWRLNHHETSPNLWRGGAARINGTGTFLRMDGHWATHT